MVKTNMSEDTLISVLVIAACPQSFRKKDSRQAGMTIRKKIMKAQYAQLKLNELSKLGKLSKLANFFMFIDARPFAYDR